MILLGDRNTYSRIENFARNSSEIARDVESDDYIMDLAIMHYALTTREDIPGIDRILEPLREMVLKHIRENGEVFREGQLVRSGRYRKLIHYRNGLLVSKTNNYSTNLGFIGHGDEIPEFTPREEKQVKGIQKIHDILGLDEFFYKNVRNSCCQYYSGLSSSDYSKHIESMLDFFIPRCRLNNAETVRLGKNVSKHSDLSRLIGEDLSSRSVFSCEKGLIHELYDLQSAIRKHVFVFKESGKTGVVYSSDLTIFPNSISTNVFFTEKELVAFYKRNPWYSNSSIDTNKDFRLVLPFVKDIPGLIRYIYETGITKQSVRQPFTDAEVKQVESHFTLIELGSFKTINLHEFTQLVENVVGEHGDEYDRLYYQATGLYPGFKPGNYKKLMSNIYHEAFNKTKESIEDGQRSHAV